MPALDLANLPDATRVAHYRADDYTAGSWPDRTANGYDLAQATGGLQPTAVADGGADFNNKPVVRFDGTDDYLRRATTPATTRPFTVVAIAKCTLNNATNKILLAGVSGTVVTCHLDPSEQIAAFGGTSTITGSTNLLDTTFLGEWFFDTSSATIRTNSISVVSGSNGTGTLTGVNVGRLEAGSQFFGGDIAEILIVSGALTAADRRYLAQYAQQRYGIAIPFPQTAAPTPSSFGTASTNHNVNMPATVASGDLLYVLMQAAAGTADCINTPTGWTRLALDSDGPASSLKYTVFAAFAKIADGTEGGTTVNFTTSASATGAAHVYRVTEFYGSLSGVEISSLVLTGTGSFNANPPSLTTPWSAAKNLWIVVAASGEDDETATAYPTNYTGGATTATGGGANNGGAISTARRELEADSDDPGAFSFSGQEYAVASVTAIRPIAAIPAAGGGIMAAGL